MIPKVHKRIAIVGGGAAGFFSAITAARLSRTKNKLSEIIIFESSNQYLKKVKISGGGRCNVTHNMFEIRKFCENYPRGHKELLSPLQLFQAQDTVAWFKEAGIRLVAEADGRMFPESNSSQTIIDCYLQMAENYGVQLQPRSPVNSMEALSEGKISLDIKNFGKYAADAVLVATGSSPSGYALAESMGHSITERAPSLFSFKISSPLISTLPGISFPMASLKLILPNKKTFRQLGPTLVTHWGLSGPAVLKLSAWAAREMRQANYQADLFINWLGDLTSKEIEEKIIQIRNENSKSFLKNSYPQEIPKRFWLKILSLGQINPDKQWANLSKKEMNFIIQALTNSEFKVSGQNRFKDEFVECGGVNSKEINFRTMESKICPNLYFAGELLDVDGITGGFNFQNAWTTGWIAAQSIIGKD